MYKIAAIRAQLNDLKSCNKKMRNKLFLYVIVNFTKKKKIPIGLKIFTFHIPTASITNCSTVFWQSFHKLTLQNEAKKERVRYTRPLLYPSG